MRTYTEEDEKRYNGVLKEIQNSIPVEWRKMAVIEQPLSPTIKMVFEKALESETISPEKKAEIKALLDSGVVSKMVPKEDPKMTQRIDQYVQRQINIAIKAGRLPPKSHIKYLPSMLRVKADDEKKAKN